MDGWVGIDLDGTLAKGYSEDIGEPVPEIVELAKELIANGVEVRIFTARASGGKWRILEVKEWCKKHLGETPEVTNVKDWDCMLILDDRAISVATDEGGFRNEYDQKRLINRLREGGAS
jgi:hypothetical protein